VIGLISDVKRGQNLEAEDEAEAKFWRLRPRPRPKIIMNNYKEVPNNDDLRKINKIPEFYTIFA